MIRATSCCGMKEICNFYTEETPEKFLMRGEINPSFLPTVIIFSDRNKQDKYGSFKRTNADEFYKMIIENDLGNVHRTKTKININSNNYINCYMWTLNKSNLRNFMKSLKTK